jgi:5-methylthioadenosine/S-adenosylhomocysteine deaminase
LSVAEGIRYGTTTLVDWGYPIKEVLDEVYIPLGLRVVATQAINGVAEGADLSPDKAYPYDDQKGETQLHENIELVENYHKKYDDRIRIMFGPHAMDMLSLDLLRETYNKARDYDVFIHMHVAQGGRENKQMMLRYGQNAIDLLHSENILSDRLIAVHCHYASSEELKLMAGEGVRMVSCPSSIGIIDGWVPPLAEYISYGGIAGLGSDQASGNNNQNILAELKVGALLNKTREKDPAVLPAWKMLRLATIEGAKAVGIDDITGSIEPGKKADMILFDLNTPTLSPVLSYPIRNIAHNIVYASRGEEIIYVIVDGKIVKEKNKLILMDEKKALAEAQEAAEELIRAGGKDYRNANSVLVKDSDKGLF